MSKRGENIYKRKDGRWEGRILSESGRYIYIYGKSYKEVKNKKKAAVIEKPASAGEIRDIAKKLDSWLNDNMKCLIKPSTYESYYYCMKKYIIPYFENSSSGIITEAQVRGFINHIYSNNLLSETYKLKIIYIFKRALKNIVSSTDVFKTVEDAFRVKKIYNCNIQIFSVKEQYLIEKEAARNADIRKLSILTGLYLGLRLGEICALRWKDIDCESKYLSISSTIARVKDFSEGQSKTKLTVGTPKSRNAVRNIPLPEFLVTMINDLNSGGRVRDNYVLTDSSVPCDPRTLQRFYKKLLQDAGVEYRKFHTVRHTFASRALEMGIDIKTVSELLGHSSVTTTLNIYAHSMMEQKKRAIDKMNDMYMMQCSSAVESAVKQ